MLRLRALVVAALALASGCRSDGPTDVAAGYSLVVTSDRAQYALTANDVARVTLTNQSERAVYLPMAEYVVYERLVDGAWRDASPWFTVDGVGQAIEFAPGATMTDEFPLSFYLGGKPGTYRFRYLVYADAQLRSPLPVAERVSAAFTVRP